MEYVKTCVLRNILKNFHMQAIFHILTWLSAVSFNCTLYESRASDVIRL